MFIRIKKTTKTKASRDLTLAFKTLVHLCAAVIAIAYVYLTFTSVLGLVFAILMGLGSLFVSVVVAYNTLQEKDPTITGSIKNQEDQKKQELNSKIFLGFAIPAILLSTVSHIIAAYTSVIILGPLLPFAIPMPILITLGVGFAAITAIATLMYDWIQTMELVDKIAPLAFIDSVETGGPAVSPIIAGRGVAVMNATHSATREVTLEAASVSSYPIQGHCHVCGSNQ